MKKKNTKTLIIAEIGWNHMGNMVLAKKMIKLAKLNGADICKFQFWSEKNLKNGPWDHDGRRKIYKKAQLNFEKHLELIKFCKKVKIDFLTSAFSLNDAKIVKKLKLKMIKIPSHEIYNTELIKYAHANFQNVLLSCGACTKEELWKLVKKYRNTKKMTFMHCVSSYPLKNSNVNFPKMIKIKNLFKNFCYSGHYENIDDCYAPIVLGAKYLEKHFTINKKNPGRDNKFAILPNELKKLVEFRNNFFLMNIDKGLEVQNCEIDIFKNYRGRWNKLN
jgi:N,N'-diacetyllegionaminate synthase